MRMKYKVLICIIFLFHCLAGRCQDGGARVDSSLLRKISIPPFTLCRTTVSDLRQLSDDLREVEVEEMDLGKKCMGEDARFVNGKGWRSEKFPGIIFQKDQGSDRIAKMRLTRDYKGPLPNGVSVDVGRLLLKDVWEMYPTLKDKWGSRDCTDYWGFGNDTIIFFVRIDKKKIPQFPVDYAYYADKPVEGIDLAFSCYSMERSFDEKQPVSASSPVFFMDSVRISQEELKQYAPTEIAMVSVYKDSHAIAVAGPAAANGAVFIFTKKYARIKYWNFFASRNEEYQKAVPSPGNESSVVYIMNGKLLKDNFEGDLLAVDEASFISLSVITEKELIRDYHVDGRAYGIVIRTKNKK
jgi:hypothetical protein